MRLRRSKEAGRIGVWCCVDVVIGLMRRATSNIPESLSRAVTYLGESGAGENKL